MSDPTCPSRSSRPTPERSTPPPTRRRRHQRYRESTPRSPIFSSNSGPARGSVSICTDFRRERIDCDPGGARGQVVSHRHHLTELAGQVVSHRHHLTELAGQVVSHRHHLTELAGQVVSHRHRGMAGRGWPRPPHPGELRARHRGRAGLVDRRVAAPAHQGIAKRPPAPATVRLTTVSRSVPQRPQ
jgi:hypothetical protein